MKSIFFHNDKPPIDELTIMTLGPAGTSSEQSALFFAQLALHQEHIHRFRIVLFDTYEEAYQRLLQQERSVVVIANAYEGINHYYMNPTLALYAAFLNNTPNYGIACKTPQATLSMRIASHPAPIPLIQELLPQHCSIERIVYYASTSQAAKAVCSGEVDAALTTETAAQLYGLTFISQVRPIKMLWSVFMSATTQAPVEYMQQDALAHP